MVAGGIYIHLLGIDGKMFFLAAHVMSTLWHDGNVCEDLADKRRMFKRMSLNEVNVLFGHKAFW